MLASPFAFYRGAAAIMAADLASGPASGIVVQADGDAHALNFGLYASPERRLLFDLNDFDETLPGPWEWDLKRLAASLAVAGRDGGLVADARQAAVAAAARSYRETIAALAGVSVLDTWYTSVEASEASLLRGLSSAARRAVGRAQSRDHLRALRKITEVVDGRRRFRRDPPLLIPLAELLPPAEAESVQRQLRGYLGAYRRCLRDEHRALLDRYRMVDVAVKVVGTGSVGQRCFVVLFEGLNGYPLVLQVKEAQRSVLDPYCAPIRHRNQGRRVVTGQRVLQSASDIFLGWFHGASDRYYYVRQLWDMKGSFELEEMGAAELADYAGLCGRCLAQAHGRSGDPVTLAGYLGTSDVLDRSLVRFAEAYADQNQRDYEALATAVRSGRLKAEIGV
jgi:uncharacterized protein (DUF2252 family)